MSYGSSGGRRGRGGVAKVFSAIVHLATIGLAVAGVVLLVQGARTAFGMAASTLKPQTGSSVSTGASSVPNLAASGAVSGAVSGSVSQSGELPPPDESDVPVVAEKKGVVVLDPGHGGGDPGCGPIGALEKDVVLSIAMILKDKLEEQDITVVMTRDTDKGVSLEDRTIIANDAQADLFVSIHCNAFEGKASGLECYYHEDEVGKQMAIDVTTAAASLGVRTREVRSQGFQVLRGTKMPAVLVEVGFLTDETERAQLLTEEHQTKLADAMLSAVLASLQTVKVPLA